MKKIFRSIGLKISKGTRYEHLLRNTYTFFFQHVAYKVDSFTRIFLKKTIAPSSVCVDVGAYRGDILRVFLKYAHRGTVFAFEPDPDNSVFLKQSFPRAVVIQQALGDSVGQTHFFRNEERPARNSLKRDWIESSDSSSTVIIDVTSLDQYFGLEQKIDILKVDAEGSELAIFRGGLSILRRCQPIIIFEHGFSKDDPMQSESIELYRTLSQDCVLNISMLFNTAEALQEDDFLECLRGGCNYFLARPSM